MKYLFVLRLCIKKFPKYFFKILKEYDLGVNVGLSDKIYVDGMFCKIKKITHDLDDNVCYVAIRAYDSIPICENESEVVPILMQQVAELEKYDWHLVDFNFGENFDENADIDLPREVQSSASMKNVEFLFLKTKRDLMTKK